MNLDRRTVLRGAAGGAALWLAASRPHAQLSANAVVMAPPRLVVAGAAQPVQLRRIQVDVEVNGRMVQTAVEFEFFNPNPRVLEGELQFPLTEGQAVGGMAMEVDGAMREAVAIDKARGEQVFEEVTRAQIDPALLSATEGNNYKLRVYPLPAHGSKRVVIRYAESAAVRGANLMYRLPLAFGKRLAELSVTVQVSGAEAAPRASAGLLTVPAFVATPQGHRLDWLQRDVVPASVLEVSYGVALLRGSVSTAQHQGRHFFLAQFPVPAARAPRALPKVVNLVWDSSASGAQRDHGREFAVLDAYFARAQQLQVRLVRVHSVAESAQVFQVTQGDWQALRQALEATVYDGATNLGAIPVPDKAVGEVLLFTDGLSNFGATGTMNAHSVPVYALCAAVRNDSARLRAWAEASGGAYIDLLALTPPEAQAQLLEQPVRLLRMRSNGAKHLVAASHRPEGGWITLAGELTERQTKVEVTLLHPAGKQQPEELTIDLDASEGTGQLAAQAWARLQVAALRADEDLNRAEIRRLTREFALVTPETSLIILDRAQDYATYDITPPPELAKAVAQLRAGMQRAREHDKRAQLNLIAQQFENKVAWWERSFPEDDLQLPAMPHKAERRARGEMRDLPSFPVPPVSVAPEASPLAAPSPSRPKPPGEPVHDKSRSRLGADSSAPSAVIRLHPAERDAAYAKRMAATPNARLYAVYLDERPAYANSTAFFLDAAELMFERGLADWGLRVLSNLAEMDLENRHVLRILAQRLIQAGQARLAIPLLRKVLRLAPFEPQSYRDLGLALAEDGQAQEGIEQLYEVITQPWSRFPEIGLITLAELNAIAAQHRGLDTSRIDRRLLKNLPLDLRAVMTWDTDNTDVDLWVTDPNGDQAYYGNPLTRQGGRMSQDVTSGYGPEEFSLRSAKPGLYRVEAKFYGHRQQIVSAATTIQLMLSTGFGTAQAHHQRVTLRLREPKERVFVGEFEVKGGKGQAVSRNRAPTM